MVAAHTARVDVAIDRFVHAAAGRSIAVETLTGPTLSMRHEADVVRPAASLLKVPLVIAAYGAARAQLDLERRVRVDELPRSRFASVLDVLAPDHEFTLRELCGVALATSDNRVANFLIELIGMAPVNEAPHDAGCRASRMTVGFADDELGTQGRANVTTATDMVELLRFLHHRDDLRTVAHAMERNPLNARIALRLPDDGRISVANKTGSLAGVVNDVAVVSEAELVLAVAVLCDGQADNARTSIDIGDCIRGLWSAVGGRLDP